MIPFSDNDLKDAMSSSFNRIKPKIKQDGGDIKLINIINGKIYVQLTGNCVGCSSSNSTIKYLVEKDVKEYIHPEIIVINVPTGYENRLDEL